MKILAIESSSITASCAVSENDVILGEYSLSHKKTHSEKLMPLIEKLLEDLQINIEEINLIGISEGPGSYTGLRIGAAIAKSLAYSLNIKIAAVPTMMSLAANVYSEDKKIISIMDAKAKRIYAGIYKWENGKVITFKEQFPSTVDDLINIINELNEPVILNGDGSEIYKNIFEENLKIKPIFAPKQFNLLKSSSLAFIANEMATENKTESSSNFTPKYLRLSQAERNVK
ncbi:MAG: tsaB [Bacillota bacterium]|jgi:tRNA threonylcarbamoyladenosine biosynthesis protein TsaB|nr:tsaB [Bacillota bacterium]